MIVVGLGNRLDKYIYMDTSLELAQASRYRGGLELAQTEYKKWVVAWSLHRQPIYT